MPFKEAYQSNGRGWKDQCSFSGVADNAIVAPDYGGRGGRV
jgi:hypothetical protein